MAGEREPRPPERGCGRLTITHLVDDVVRDVILSNIHALEGLPTLRGDDANLILAVRDAEERLQTLVEDYANGLITAREWHTGRPIAESRLAKLRAALDDERRAYELTRVFGGTSNLWQAWQESSIGVRAAIVARRVEQIDVGPGLRGGGRRSPEEALDAVSRRLTFRWRQPEQTGDVFEVRS